MKAKKSHIGDVVVLTLSGELDTFVVKQFDAELRTIREEGTRQIVLNMRLVKFATTSAFGSMLRARKALREVGGELVISTPSVAVREPLEQLGLDTLFTLYPDDEAALAGFTDG